MAVVEHAHLEPIVEAMLERGNSWRTQFQPSQGGWWCQLDRTLDAAICAEAERDCASVSYDAEDDSLFCRHCWAIVYGGSHTFPGLVTSG